MTEVLGFYSVKTLDIFLSSIYYFIYGSLFSILLDKYIPDIIVKDLSNTELIFQTLFIFGIIGIGFYLLRLFVKRIPYPFDGYYGYNHLRLREVTGGIIVGYIIFSYQSKLFERIDELRNRLFLSF